MPFARISSKLPSNHPSNCPILPVTDTSTHYIASVASGSAAALLTIPASAVDVDGRRFSISLAGRVKLTSGASSGTFNPGISHGYSPIIQNLFTPSLTLPASASNVYLPFNLHVGCAYDALAQQLYVTYGGFLGNYTNNAKYSPTAAVPLQYAATTNGLIFCAWYNFSVAPLSGTTVEILELVLG